MYVAALVLDAAAAVGNSPVQMPPYVAAPRGDNTDQLRLMCPTAPPHDPAQKEKLKAISS
jgi:hypothetical protein